jgi:hypothetical protein
VIQFGWQALWLNVSDDDARLPFVRIVALLSDQKTQMAFLNHKAHLTVFTKGAQSLIDHFYVLWQQEMVMIFLFLRGHFMVYRPIVHG